MLPSRPVYSWRICARASLLRELNLFRSATRLGGVSERIAQAVARWLCRSHRRRSICSESISQVGPKLFPAHQSLGKLSGRRLKFSAAMFITRLTRQLFCCFIVISEARNDPEIPRQARRRPALHHRDPARLLAPSHHPSCHRLFRLRPRQRPPGLGFDHQLSGRPHQADQPSPCTDTDGPPVAAQLPEAEG